MLEISLEISLIHLMRATARARASTRITSLMRVRNSTRRFFYDTYCLGLWNEKNQRTKTSN